MFKDVHFWQTTDAGGLLASQNFSHVSFVRLSAAHGGEYRLPSIMNYVRFTPQSGHWPCTSKGGDRLADASQVYKKQQQQPGADVWRTPPPKRRGWDLSAASFDHLVGERDRRGASPSSTTLNIESFIAPPVRWGAFRVSSRCGRVRSATPNDYDSTAALPLGVIESQPLVWPNLASSSHPSALA